VAIRHPMPYKAQTSIFVLYDEYPLQTCLPMSLHRSCRIVVYRKAHIPITASLLMQIGTGYIHGDFGSWTTAWPASPTVRPSTSSLNHIRTRSGLFHFPEPHEHFQVIQLAIESVHEHSPVLTKLLRHCTCEAAYTNVSLISSKRQRLTSSTMVKRLAKTLSMLSNQR
jgi:hypothetical protein